MKLSTHASAIVTLLSCMTFPTPLDAFSPRTTLQSLQTSSMTTTSSSSRIFLESKDSRTESEAYDDALTSSSDMSSFSRRQVLQSTATSILLSSASTITAAGSAYAAEEGAQTQTIFESKSGLKYIDLKPGTGRSPQYGDLCSISYKAAIKLPSTNGVKTKPEAFDSDKSFLIKHGNGKTIPGLDEGIHTMKVGGVRRLIIPPKLGYVANGLGPFPANPWDRRKLGDLLDGMIAARGGQLIFEVELRSVIEDEANQGYYTDQSLTPEDFDKLRLNLQKAGREARESRMRNTI